MSPKSKGSLYSKRKKNSLEIESSEENSVMNRSEDNLSSINNSVKVVANKIGENNGQFRAFILNKVISNE